MKRALIDIETRRWGEVVAFASARKTEHVGRGKFGMLPEKKSILAGDLGQLGHGNTTEGKGPNEPSDLTSSKDVHPKMIDRKLQATLGRHLRGMFDDVARLPVPDKFLELLENLGTKELGTKEKEQS